MPEHLRADLAGLPAPEPCHRIEVLPEIGDHRLLAGPGGREEEPADPALLLST